MLVTNSSQHKFQSSKTNFVRFEIFDDEFVGVELVKPEVELDRPIYLGATILELAKVKMYDYWYNVLKKQYQQINLCFTGTASIKNLSELDF